MRLFHFFDKQTRFPAEVQFVQLMRPELGFYISFKISQKLLCSHMYVFRVCVRIWTYVNYRECTIPREIMDLIATTINAEMSEWF